MKSQSDAPQKPSRRNFAKTITAALITLPLTSSQVGAQVKRSKSSGAKPGKSGQSRLKELTMRRPLKSPQTPCDSSQIQQEVLFADEPPVVVGGGSFFIELGQMAPLSEPMANTGGPARRPLKYTKAGLHNGSITRVHVITTLKSNFDYTVYYPVFGAKLELWLQRLQNDGTFNRTDLEDEPHIVVKGNPFVLETDDRLDSVDHNKPYRRDRHEHREYPNVRYFRIGRWRLGDWDESVGDDFQFMITLCHTDQC